MLKNYLNFCEDRKKNDKYRSLTIDDSYILMNFSTNDYLCLGSKDNKDAIEFGIKIAQKYGLGSTGSRLLSGNNEFFTNFEKQIATDKKTECALIFNSGYQANISAISSLCDWQILESQAQVFFDKSNHSSLYQGVFLSKAELIRYNHNNLKELESLLEKNKDIKKAKFIVTESIFGMDGDKTDLDKIVNLAIQYDALLYIDEAHATGVFGENGYGLANQYTNLYDKIVIMGTFSKAIGTSGAYIASNQTIINYLINKSPGFIYSTATSPMIIGSTYYNWQLIKEKYMIDVRKNLLEKAAFLQKNLKKLSFNTINSNTHIILIEAKNEKSSLDAKEKLLLKNILVSAIRPPTTPTSRIRIALNANHTYDDINFLIKNLIEMREFFQQSIHSIH
jgi:8-amino-7-oxononanoate synthase